MLGQGTASNPYLISNEEDLNKIRENTQASYRLTNDIYMTSYQLGEGWLPIEEFGGDIDGGNYTIHDLYINRPNESVGFIRDLVDSTPSGQTRVTNLHFKGVNIVGGARTGVIAGMAKGYSDVVIDYYGYNRSSVIPVVISGCTVEGTIRSSSSDFGGIIGTTRADVTPSAWNDNQLVNVYIQDTHADLEMYAFSSNVGGLVGNASNGSIRIERSSSRGKIVNGYDNIGGLVGRLVAGRGAIYDSYSLMDLQGANYVGGIVGEIRSGHVQSVSISRVYFAGTIDAPNRSGTNIGPLQGFWQGISNGDGSIYNMPYDEQKAGLNSLRYNQASVRKGNGRPLSTEQMMDVSIFVDSRFDIINTWYSSEGSQGKYLELKNEFNEDLFTMLGDGTRDNPYQIDNIHKLISITSYDRKNWTEYNGVLDDENDFHSPNYKPDMNFTAPRRYHYKLTNDINLDIYPWNVIGWYPLTKVNETVTQTTLPLERIDDTLWNRLWIEANNSFRVYNSIGEVIAYTDGISTLNTTATGHGGLGGQGLNKHVKGFMGILNGNNFSINGLKLKEWRGLRRLGLFDVISGGTVENLRLENTDVDFDYYRGNGIPDVTINAGVLSSTIQAGSNIKRVSIEGTSKIKDYRRDVRGARVNVSGFINEGRRYDRSVGSESLRSVIANSSIKIDNTFTNVDISDDYMSHFTPFMNSVAYTRIETSYSASTHRAISPQGRILSGTHGDRVFARTISSTGVILKSYYDSEIVNAESGSEESPVTGRVEIYGRNTEAMKLQSTYIGWDFENIWDIDGFDYPEFKPYDEFYVPPVYKTDYLVKTTVEALFMRAQSDAFKRNTEIVTLKSFARKSVSNTIMGKTGSTGVTTKIDELFGVAFAYDNPVIGSREVSTGIESIEGEVDYGFTMDRHHIVLTTVDEISIETETDRVNRGAFYNGISVEAIRNNEIVIKINDRGVKYIEHGDTMTSTEGRDFITIYLDKSDFEMGKNEVQIRGLGDEPEDILITKDFVVERELRDNPLNKNILINGEYYKVIKNEQGLLTLDRELSKNAYKYTPSGSYNTLEVSTLTATPKINGEELTHVGSSYDGGFIRDDYELEIETSRVTTEIELERTPPIDDIVMDVKDKRLIEDGYIKAYAIAEESAIPSTTRYSNFGTEFSEEQYEILSSTDAEGVKTSFNDNPDESYVRGHATHRFKFDIVRYLEEVLEIRIPRDTVEEKAKWLNSQGLDMEINWEGKLIGVSPDGRFSKYTRDGFYGPSFQLHMTAERVDGESHRTYGTIKGFRDELVSKEGEVDYTITQDTHSSASYIGLVAVETKNMSAKILLDLPEDENLEEYIDEIGQTYIPKEKNRGEF